MPSESQHGLRASSTIRIKKIVAAVDTFSKELLNALKDARPWDRMKLVKDFGDREENQLPVAAMTPLLELMTLTQKAEGFIMLLHVCIRAGDPDTVCADLEAVAETAFAGDDFNKRNVSEEIRRAKLAALAAEEAPVVAEVAAELPRAMRWSRPRSPRRRRSQRANWYHPSRPLRHPTAR